MIKSLGFTGYTANGMAAPASAIGLVFSVSLAYSSDRFREKGLHIALAMVLPFIGCMWLALVSSSAGTNVLYGGYLLAAGTMATGQAINAVSRPVASSTTGSSCTSHGSPLDSTSVADRSPLPPSELVYRRKEHR